MEKALCKFYKCKYQLYCNILKAMYVCILLNKLKKYSQEDITIYLSNYVQCFYYHFMFVFCEMAMRILSVLTRIVKILCVIVRPTFLCSYYFIY